MPKKKLNFSTQPIKKISIVIPAYNEAATLPAVLDQILHNKIKGLDLEIIIVNDASTDRTVTVLKKITKSSYRLISHETNQGKGAALRTGLQAATGDIIIIQDADLEYSPADYPVLVAPILEGKADVVFGSRFAGATAHRVLYFWHTVANYLLTILSNMFTNLNLTDMEVGYKVFTKPVMQKIVPHLESQRFGFEPEITAKVAQLGVRLYEVGISYAGRTYAEGKKIGWRDAVEALYCIIKFNTWKCLPKVE